MITKRIDYLDTAKAIGILLMILGHCQYIGDIPGLGRLIYSFHMPLFFIISGLFVKPYGIKVGIRKYSKAYLLPYATACALMLLLTVILCLINKWTLSEHVLIAIKSYLFASGSTKGTAFLHDYPKVGMIWFFFALFWSCLFYSFIKKIAKGWWELLSFSFLLFMLGFISGKYIRLPFSIQAGMCATIYIMVGDAIRKYDAIIIFSKSSKNLLCLMLLAWIGSAMLLGGLNMACNSYNDGIIQIPISIIATLLLFYVCFKTNLKIRWLGQNTLFVLVGHQLFKSYCWQTNFNFDSTIPINTPPIPLLLEFVVQVFMAILIGVMVKKMKIV